MDGSGFADGWDGGGVNPAWLEAMGAAPASASGSRRPSAPPPAPVAQYAQPQDGFQQAQGDPVLLNRRAAFDVFDVEHNGTVSGFDLPMALMGCDDVRRAVRAHGIRGLYEPELQAAMDRVGADNAGLVTFQQFAQIGDILVHSLEPRRIDEERRAGLFAQEEEDEVYMALGGGMPSSPRGPKALLHCSEAQPGLGPIQRAFYSFDQDNSGAVSAHEVPQMLRLVGIGPKTNNPDAWRKYDYKWHDALASIYPPKEPSELINVQDFHDLCLELKPSLEREFPERPRPKDASPSPDGRPGEEMSPEEIEELERQRLEEERLRLEEEERARRDEEIRFRKAELHVRLPDGTAIQVPNVTREHKVGDVARLIDAAVGIPASMQRLICQGWEMNNNATLESYKVRTGDPRQDKGHTVVVLLRKPEPPTPGSPGGPPLARTQFGNLTVRSVGGQAWSVMAKADDSVSEVMVRVQDVSGVPVNQQRLVGNGKELAPFERLRDAQLGPGDTVVLLPRGWCSGDGDAFY